MLHTAADRKSRSDGFDQSSHISAPSHGIRELSAYDSGKVQTSICARTNSPVGIDCAIGSYCGIRVIVQTCGGVELTLARSRRLFRWSASTRRGQASPGQSNTRKCHRGNA